MFERFTENAIKVIMSAQEESKRMGSGFVGTEHLFLGVVSQRGGIGARALKYFKVTMRIARREVDKYNGGLGAGYISSDMPFTPRAKRVMEMAVQEGKDLGQNFVGPEHLLLALMAESDGVAMRIMELLKIDFFRLRNLILAYIEEAQEEILRPLTQAERFLLEREEGDSPTPTLDEYSKNLSKKAMDGLLDPVIGRQKEINEVIAVLSRRTKSNPILIGEPGVGKTAVAEGLAQLILTEQKPRFLEGVVIMALDLGSILAGTKYRGEFEERVKKIVEEVNEDRSVIVLIDEMHNLVGAGAAEGAVDAANILKPALARGEFRCIGATTTDEYTRYIERDPALARRFQIVRVNEPSREVSTEILYGLRPDFEHHHGLGIQDKALSESVVFSDQYIADRYLPDKAIDVIDQAAAKVRLENRCLPEGLQILLEELSSITRDKERAVKTLDFDRAQAFLDHESELRAHVRIIAQTLSIREGIGTRKREVDMVTANDVAGVIADWTGIPVQKLTGSEAERLLNMEEIIHERIVGQRHAVTAVSKAIRRARVGLRNPNRPIASFMFAGPTGVGKTELTKALSEYMFAQEDNMIRLDMSEYMEKHTVAKLIGSPPGYVGYNEGGQLTEAVRKKPYSVVLLDEVEKAHEDVFNLLLQVLDDGRLTDSKGRVIDFKNTLLIMTTNLGAKAIEAACGIEAKSENDQDFYRKIPDKMHGWEPIPEPPKDKQTVKRLTKLVHDQLKGFFRPEFLNRIDDIIIFNHLTPTDIWEICGLMIKQLQNRLEEKLITLIVDESVRAFLTDIGYDPLYGARPLRRAIMKNLEDALAEKCLSTILYPKTKLSVSRKRVEQNLGLLTQYIYTDELVIDIDVSGVSKKVMAEAEAAARGEKLVKPLNPKDDTRMSEIAQKWKGKRPRFPNDSSDGLDSGPLPQLSEPASQKYLVEKREREEAMKKLLMRKPKNKKGTKPMPNPDEDSKVVDSENLTSKKSENLTSKKSKDLTSKKSRTIRPVAFLKFIGKSIGRNILGFIGFPMRTRRKIMDHNLNKWPINGDPKKPKKGGKSRRRKR